MQFDGGAQLPAAPVVPKQLPSPELPVKVLPSPQGPSAGFDPGLLARLAAIEAALARLNLPITFIDAGGRQIEAYLGDTVRVKIPAVNPDLQLEVRHGGR